LTEADALAAGDQEGMSGMRNGHYPCPARPELQAAHDEMDAKGITYAYVCRTHDGQAWEVTTRQGGMYAALDGRYLDHDEAMAAGVAWLLEQLDREPTADEAAYRTLWEAQDFSR
jgi:hypothetical protein